MFGQSEHRVSDAETASVRTRPLTPVSDNSGNGPFGSKKRKRDGSTMDDLLKDKFVVKPYPSKGPSKQQTLQPLMLLPRSHLPLSSLDIAASAKALAQSRLFEAHVKILELEERMGTQPMVLIARLDDARTLYAVERESRGLYVLCQLGSWVNLHKLKAAAVASKQEFPKRPVSLVEEPSLPTITPEISKFNKKKRLAIEAIQSMVKRPTSNLLTESPSDSPSVPPEGVPAIESQAPEHTNVEPPVDDVISPPTATEIFENVRTQYFEALYLSKASLAYFAKGPLSRARAAFHMDFDSTLDLKDHVTFLESLIMSSTLIDKKYRDGVPVCISLLDVQDHSEDNADQATAKTKKRRSSKKFKPGKNGLYPTEETLIRKWWDSHDDDADSGAPGDSREERTKNRISQLRIRETQLQMIVILELLALRPLTSNSEDLGGNLPLALPTTEPTDVKQKPVKSKKPDHLTMLIDVHIDRLCIWQSLALEATKAPISEPQIVNEKMDDPATRANHSDNILRDFCVEVIAPFFSSRLPDRCAAINRKLGGPVIASPPKPRLSKSASFSGAPSRPGAATKRPVPAKPRQSLKRVLTDDRERRSMSRGPNRAISLMRSATMPSVPGMKREVSEAPSLSSIPTVDSQTFEAKRGGLLTSKQFSRREIDLTALVPKTNTKAEKQAAIEAELKEAISALKKPNRELAGKSIVETAEKRSASSRKSKKPIRNPLFQTVQISATPKANRQKDMFVKPQFSSAERTIDDSMVIPLSSFPKIPQPVSRSSGGMSSRNPFLSSVQATPTRKSVPAFSRLSGNIGGFSEYFPPSSPLQARRPSTQLFTTVPDSAIKKPSTTCGIADTPIKGIADTPVKGMSGHGHPIALESSSNKENFRLESEVKKVSNQNEHHDVTNEVSIYKSLGWDDADDIDELA